MNKTKFISEAGVNKCIYPVIKPTSEDVIKYDDFGDIVFIAKAGCIFNLQTYKVLGAIATIIRKVTLNHHLKKGININGDECKLFKLTENPSKVHMLLDKHIEEDKLDLDLRYDYFNEVPPIKISTLLSNPCLKSMQHKDLYTALNNINNFQFKAKYKFYSIVNMDGKQVSGGFHGVYDNTGTEFEKLMNIDIIEGKQSLNGKSFGNKIVISFNSVMGALFQHNIFTKGFSYQNKIDLLNTCSSNAQLIYLHFILPYSFQTKLTVDKITDYLSLSNKNKTSSRNILIRIVEELSSKKIISIEKFNDDKNDFYYMVKELN